MSETKFTKGPWRVAWPVPKADLCQKIITADGSAIMGNETYYPWCPEKGHDWVLIAAAPDMYDQLQESTDCMVCLVDALNSSGHSTSDLEAQIERNNAILAKARGES